MVIRITSSWVTQILNLAVFNLERKTPPTTCSRQTLLLLWKTIISQRHQLNKWHQHQDQLVISPWQTGVLHHDAHKYHPVVHLRKYPMLIFSAILTQHQTQTSSVEVKIIPTSSTTSSSSMKSHCNLSKWISSNNKTLQALAFSLRMLAFTKILKRDQIDFSKTLQVRDKCSWVEKTQTWEQAAKLPHLQKMILLRTTITSHRFFRS